MNINEILNKLGIEPDNSGTSTGSKWLASKGAVISSSSPVNGQVIASLQSTDAAGYEKVMEQASQAFLHWRKVPAPKRGEMVRQFGDALREHKDALGALVSFEMGKSLQEGLGSPLSTLVPEWGGKQMPEAQEDADLSGRRYHPYAHLRDIQSGKANGRWTATWRYDHSGLRIHSLSPQNVQVFKLRSAAIRPAAEDDNKLDNYMRSSIMQRHSGGKSSFITVHTCAEITQCECYCQGVCHNEASSFIECETENNK